MIPLKSKAVSVNLQTGEETPIEGGGMFLMPPAKHLCQTCAVDHAADQPHNQQSLFYQVAFNAQHGRWPTWRDAVAHCTPEIQAVWLDALIERGIDVGPAEEPLP